MATRRSAHGTPAWFPYGIHSHTGSLIRANFQFTQDGPGLIASHVLPERLGAALVELGPYLTEAFGNPVRIDYGSGVKVKVGACVGPVATTCMHRP